MIKVGCHSLTWANFYQGAEYDLRKVLTDIKRLGYAGVELVEPLSALGDAEAFKQYLHTLGLELISLSCSLDSEAKRRIDFLSKFDTDVAMLYSGWVAKRNRREGFLIQSLRSDVDSIADYARKQDINIALHPHKDTLIETKEDLEDFYSEPTNVKLCLDIAHVAACGSDPLKVLKEFKNKIAYIHLKDYDAQKNEFVELGQGSLNLGNILSYLRREYDGWVTVELDHTHTDPVESAKVSREYLKSLGF